MSYAGPVGVSLDERLPPREFVECVRLAEDLGYHSAWVTEGRGGDAFSILTACALGTSCILLGTAVVSVFIRSAPLTAMGAATVDIFSNGRLLLGLGSSHKVQVEGEHGLPYDRPLTRVRETVAMVRDVLRQGWVSHQGQAYQVRRFELRVPLQRREVPIYLGAVRPAMCQACGEIAQGAILTSPSLENAAMAAQNVALGARRVGRDPAQVQVAGMLRCSLGDDLAAARRPLRASLAARIGFYPRYRRMMAEGGFAEAVDAVQRAWAAGDLDRAAAQVPDALVDARTLAGPASRCRARLEEYRAVGISLPIVTPVYDPARGVAGVAEVLRALAPRG